MKQITTTFLLLISLFLNAQNLPEGFSYLKDIDKTIQKELRYCYSNNFIGSSINSYEENILITSTKTANALKKAQSDFFKQNLSLKIFDAYRPQNAVNHFVKWAKKPHDTLMKQQYYPELNKRNLFKLGYISTKSGHSRGSSVDVTLVNLKTGEEVDMGSPYDYFGNISHINYSNLTIEQKKNRRILLETMSKNGFRPYKNEWWHFTLRNEPFPKTYFNFPIK